MRVSLNRGNFSGEGYFQRQNDSVATLAFIGTLGVFPMTTVFNIEDEDWKVAKATISQYNPKVVNLRLERV